MKTLLILALEGAMDSSLTITLDTIRAGQQFQAGAARPGRLRVLVASHRRTVRTGGGLRLDADLVFSEVMKGAVRPDWIVIPGLGLVSGQAVSERFLQKDAIAAMALLRHVPDTTRIAAACSSVFLLAEAGLLGQRHVTMTWWLAKLFRARYPDVRLDEARMLVRDGRYLTAGSAYAALDMALAIVAETMGTAIAHLCSRYLLIDQRPSQARYMVQTHVQHVEPTVVAAERWIDAHLAGPISITALAKALAVTPRTLARRITAATGISPVKFVQRRRLLHAAHLIETTSGSIESIAAAVGYQDGTALRKLVKREFGTTPAALRA